MKPTEHGGLRLDSKKEFDTALTALDHVTNDSEEPGSTLAKLQGALTLQLGPREAGVEAGEEGVSFSAEFDEDSSKFVLAALRITADHHSDPAMREHASSMIMDYSMTAASEEVEMAENQAPQIPPQTSPQDQ